MFVLQTKIYFNNKNNIKNKNDLCLNFKVLLKSVF